MSIAAEADLEKRIEEAEPETLERIVEEHLCTLRRIAAEMRAISALGPELTVNAKRALRSMSGHAGSIGSSAGRLGLPAPPTSELRNRPTEAAADSRL